MSVAVNRGRDRLPGLVVRFWINTCAKFLIQQKLCANFEDCLMLFGFCRCTDMSRLFVHAKLCALFWFKRQGVSTLSLCSHTDGVLQPLSEWVVGLRADLRSLVFHYAGFSG